MTEYDCDDPLHDGAFRVVACPTCGNPILVWATVERTGTLYEQRRPAARQRQGPGAKP